MQIGSGWTSKDDNKQVTGISIKVDETITELIPVIKGLRFVLKPIPKEQRQTEKSPAWRLIMFKPEEAANKTQQNTQSSVEDEEIPF